MAKIRKRLFKEIRDELGYFPTWPVGDALTLGKIGVYKGKDYEIEWIDTLDNLGFQISASGAQKQLFDEKYATSSAVTFDFRSESSVINAEIVFHKKSSIAAQGFGMAIKKLSVSDLNTKVVPEITSGAIEWKSDYVVLSELFEADGFSTFVGGAEGSKVVLSATSAATSGSFNIADINAGIGLTKSEKMAYEALCKTNATPYFYIHKLINNKGKPYFRRYADRVPKFYV